jgi:SAM-dependent methyltransferase
MTGPSAALSIPFVYRSFQWAVGTPRVRQFVFDHVIQFPERARVLDVGCGPGELLPYVPKDAEYTGFDHCSESIRFAQRKYGDRGRFFHLDVNDHEKLALREGEYDVVMIFTVLHHLNDQEVAKVLNLARSCLKPDGAAFSVDGVYLKDQSWAAKYILSKDRGRFVRTEDQYVGLVKRHFEEVNVHIKRGLLRIPTDLIIIEMRKQRLERMRLNSPTMGEWYEAFLGSRGAGSKGVAA